MLSAELRKSLETATSRYVMNLASDSGLAAVAYLESRGIPLAVARRYRLGLVDEECELHGKEMAGRISIPYLTRSGVVSLKFRAVGDSAYKYMEAYDKRLYNTLSMDRADRSGILGIAEGEFDALVADALCDIPCVGIPGVDSYRGHPEWRELFRVYPRVLIFEDQDDWKTRIVDGKEHRYKPGEELSKALRKDLDGAARIIRLPGHDINDTFKAFGRDGVRRAAGLED